MYDVTKEKNLGAAMAARRLALDGLDGIPSPEKVIRWMTVGVKRGDVRIRLEGAKLGGRWVTSAAALQRFAEQLTAQPTPASAQRSPASRRRDDERADRELRERGL